ncbi:MAG: leucyl aminopeptidase [Acidobacteria bacterium]|nr:leucyl aminopeptidase [Acidobacteriota bacterium]
MHDATLRSDLRAVSGTPSTLDAELLVLPTWDGDDLADVPELDVATAGALADARARGEWRGKAYATCLAALTDAAWPARRVLLIGTGPDRGSTGQIRRVAAAAMIEARGRRVASLAFCLRAPSQTVEAAQAAAEGLTLGEFDGGSYKTDGDHHVVDRVLVARAGDAGDAEQADALERAVARGRLLGTCSNDARAMANEPSNTLTPTVFADRARRLAEGTSLTVDVLEQQQIEELGMGLLLGVARGSAEPPRLIVVEHEPDGGADAPVLGLVGKGITFDSGGISLKPPESMELMKDDMAGGAAVIAAMRAISLLGVPIRVIGVVPATENLPGGRAIKPGDVLRSADGQTVEVINTDAEGRLILGDALWYAKRCGATHLVDVATLTGGCVVALGKITSGLFGAPDRWVDAVRRAAGVAGDRVWPLPVFDEYADQIRSDIADLKNTGGRAASPITAAMFLKAFIGDTPWAHLDVAGTAWSEEARPYQAKGPSGVAVRTLVELACAHAGWTGIGG